MIVGVPVWALWAIVAAALAIGEVFTPGLFFLGPLAVSALAAALVAALATSGLGGLLAFIFASVIAIAVLRPLARRHIRLPALGRNETTCSRRSINGRKWSTKGTTSASPGVSVRW
jgi:membrane protein implicated in regulation of membrane protease activity